MSSFENKQFNLSGSTILYSKRKMYYSNGGDTVVQTKQKHYSQFQIDMKKKEKGNLSSIHKRDQFVMDI
jgi:hypothetical protein